MQKRIIHVASLVAPLGHAAPGGAEQVVCSLAEAQLESPLFAGHQISIVATDDSKLPKGVQHIKLGLQSGALPARNTGDFTVEAAARNLARERDFFKPLLEHLDNYKREISFLHNHAYDEVPIFELPQDIPTLHTLHLPPMVPSINERLADEGERPQNLSTVSTTCAKLYQNSCEFTPRVIYNGIDLSEVPFVTDHGKYLLWAGRISPEKGLHAAIEVASAAKLELHIAGRVYDREYFDREISAKLSSPLIHYHGPLPRRELLELMSGAKALLFPINWDEPFGLVLIESLATGTPIIAYDRGAVREIVKDKKTGLIANSIDEMKLALNNIEKTTCRAECRKSVEDEFSMRRTIANYHRAYLDSGLKSKP